MLGRLVSCQIRMSHGIEGGGADGFFEPDIQWFYEHFRYLGG